MENIHKSQSNILFCDFEKSLFLNDGTKRILLYNLYKF